MESVEQDNMQMSNVRQSVVCTNQGRQIIGASEAVPVAFMAGVGWKLCLKEARENLHR